MQISIEDVEVRLVADAVNAEVLATGRLMSPEDVKGYVYTDGSAVDTRAIGWVLCGDVHPSMYESLRGGAQLESSVGIIAGTNGTRFLVVQQRAGAWAHRFVLPLVGDIARNLVRKASSEGFLTSLSARNESLAIIQSLDLANAVGEDSRFEDVQNLQNPRG